jgi:hypothetical protein
MHVYPVIGSFCQTGVRDTWSLEPRSRWTGHTAAVERPASLRQAGKMPPPSASEYKNSHRALLLLRRKNMRAIERHTWLDLMACR